MDTQRQDAQVDVLVLDKGASEYRRIPATLEGLQSVVGGDIEQAGAFDPEESGAVVLYVNEEGKLRGLRPTLAAPWLGDILVGPVLVTAMDEEGEPRSLTSGEFFAVGLMLDGLLLDETGALLHPAPRRRSGRHTHHHHDGEHVHD